jgi:geranylgeranyl pyrophosphate synthase
MTPNDFPRIAERDRLHVDARLREIVATLASHHDRMGEAIGYALLEGGKRLRPLLCLWTHDVFAGAESSRTRRAALDASCAIECVHTYSLVHDDLPCMDDDDLRRGKPSVHRRYDDATAVLVGDALLALAFEILGRLPAQETNDAAALDAVRVLASAAGTGGLITGQALDLSSTASDTTRGAHDIPLVERIHEFKTARLFAAAMEIGAAIAWEGRGPAEARERVRHAGLLAGGAFQIVDDLLDLNADAKTLGKTPRKDVDRGKLTFPSAAGVAAAEKTARERIGQALELLPEAANSPLADLLAFVAERRS